MALRCGASASGTATLRKAVLSVRAVQKSVAGGDVIPVVREGIHRARRFARLRRAGCAGVCCSGQGDVKRHRQGTAKRNPKPGIRMNQHSHRALPQCAAVLCPTDKGRVGWPIRGEQRLTLELLRNGGQHAFGPAINWIWCAVRPFRRIGHTVPPLPAALGADQHKGLQGGRAEFGVGGMGRQSNQMQRLKRRKQVSLRCHGASHAAPRSESSIQRRVR